MMTSDTNWLRLLLLDRLRELGDIKLPAVADAGGICYGTPPAVQSFLAAAISALKAGRLDRCERWCVVVEHKIIREREKFQAALCARHAVDAVLEPEQLNSGARGGDDLTPRHP